MKTKTAQAVYGQCDDWLNSHSI